MPFRNIANSPATLAGRVSPVCTALALLAFDGTVHAASASGSAAFTTDYVWRGTSQTQGDPAVQAGFMATSRAGIYASAWGSNVEFAPGTRASSELDLAVGWAGAIAPDWTLDTNLLHYRYPATTVDLNWTELNGKLTYAGRYWLAAGYSPEALGSDDRGLYTQLGMQYPLPHDVALELAVGHYLLDDVHDDSYWHGQAGIRWAFKPPLQLRLTVHTTDSAAERIFGEHLAGDRVEAALQTTF